MITEALVSYPARRFHDASAANSVVETKVPHTARNRRDHGLRRPVSLR